MDKKDLEILGSVWPKFFPRDKLLLQDKRVAAITMFRDFFKNEGKRLIAKLNPVQEKSLYFDVSGVNQLLPFPDFIDTLRTRPNEVIGCLGCAVSIIKTREFSSNLSEPFCIRPRFQNFSSDCSFGDLKSGTVGQLVNIKGYVVRVSPCRPLIEGVNFKCSKCMQKSWTNFEDGIFNPPDECKTEKCRNKWLDFQRTGVMASDYQRIKIQEIDALEEAARVPRTFDVEVRGDLVNICIPGDVLRVVGVVKAMQNDAPRGGGGRGGGKESGLHQLYLVANSLQCVKSSGDRSAPINGSSDSNNNSSSDRTAVASSNKESEIGAEESNVGLGRPSLVSFTPNELKAVRTIALSEGAEGCLGLLVASLCPTIFGHELVKLGLLLALFGGTRSTSSHSGGQVGNSIGGTHVRPDIHVLVVGDPGLGKSQLLRAAAAVAPRAVFVCGNTTTTAGLLELHFTHIRIIPDIGCYVISLHASFLKGVFLCFLILSSS